MAHARRRHRRALSVLALLAAAPGARTATSEAGKERPGPAFRLPPLEPLREYSFRGPIPDDGRVANWDLSGHAAKAATSEDFVQLIHPQPLSHGAIFTTKPLPKDTTEWVAEFAFRLHGPASTASIDPRTGEAHHIAKGGRGLALWYTKDGGPTEVTVPGDKSKALKPHSHAHADDAGSVSQKELEHHDPALSLFGNRAPFDGLGVVIDASATHPLFARSDKRGWGRAIWADRTTIISGLMDDGTGEHDWKGSAWAETPEKAPAKGWQSWIEGVNVGGKTKESWKGRKSGDGKEARYLAKSTGDCEAALRNANGLVWVRVAHFNKTIRVDLDLAPHTNLANSDRTFSYHCFTTEGVALPPGYHLGMTALASGNPEPDAVDVYGIDVWKVSQDALPAQEVPPAVFADLEEKKVLDGTDEVPEQSVNDQILLGQTISIQHIDEIGKRMMQVSDTLFKLRQEYSDAMTQLSALSAKLDTVTSLGGGGGGQDNGGLLAAINGISMDMAEVRKSAASSQNDVRQSIASLQHQSTDTQARVRRIAEVVEQLRRTSEEDAAKKAKAGGSSSIPTSIVIFIVLMLVAIAVAYAVAGEGFTQRRGKKMI